MSERFSSPLRIGQSVAYEMASNCKSFKNMTLGDIFEVAALASKNARHIARTFGLRRCKVRRAGKYARVKTIYYIIEAI